MMARSKSARKKAFLDNHKVCCFCAIADAVEVDHIPSRESFKDRFAAEDYEFPACYPCNHGISNYEQSVALALRRVELKPENQSTRQLEKLLRDVRRYNPTMLPIENMTLDQKKAAYIRYNLAHPSDDQLLHAEMVGNTEDTDLAFHAFGRKLTCALYYKELKSILPLENLIMTGWQAATHPLVNQDTLPWLKALPNLVKGKRKNTNIGNQFSYRWDGNLAERKFWFVARFGSALLFRGDTIRPSDAAHSALPIEGLLPHAEDAATLWHTKEA